MKRLFDNLLLYAFLCLVLVLVAEVVAKIQCRRTEKASMLKGTCDDFCSHGYSSTQCKTMCECDLEAGASDICNSNVAPGGRLDIAENARSGSILVAIPARVDEQWDFLLGRREALGELLWNELQQRFQFLQYSANYTLVMDHALDLETIRNEYGYTLTALTLIFTCKVVGTEITKTKEIFLAVRPVNEWAPEFKENPLQGNIPENTAVSNYVFILERHAEDRDVNPITTEISSYQVWQYLPDDRLDGRTYFMLNDTQIGLFILTKALDYETLAAVNETSFYLNVSVSDVHGLMTFGTLILHVTDVDDLPPEFYHPGCPPVLTRSKPCFVSYTARVPVGYEGELTNMYPGPVQAKDMDTLNAPIVYDLKRAPGERSGILDAFVINATSGEIRIISAFKEPEIVTIVIVAQERTDRGRFTQASLQITAFEQNGQDLVFGMLKDEQRLNEKTEQNSKQGMPLFMIITLVLGLLLLATHLLLCVLCIKYKSDYRPRVGPYPPAHTSPSQGSVVSISTHLGTAPMHTISYIQSSEYTRQQDVVTQQMLSVRYDGQVFPDKIQAQQEPLPLRPAAAQKHVSRPAKDNSGPAGMGTNGQEGDNAQVQVNRNKHQTHMENTPHLRRVDDEGTSNVSKRSLVDFTPTPISTPSITSADSRVRHPREVSDTSRPSTAAQNITRNNLQCRESPDPYVTPMASASDLGLGDESNFHENMVRPVSTNPAVREQTVDLRKQRDNSLESMDSGEAGSSSSMTSVSSELIENVTAEQDPGIDRENDSASRPEPILQEATLGEENNVLSLMTLERASLLSESVKSGVEVPLEQTKIIRMGGAQDNLAGQVIGDAAYLAGTELHMARPYTGPGHRPSHNTLNTEVANEVRPRTQTTIDNTKRSSKKSKKRENRKHKTSTFDAVAQETLEDNIYPPGESFGLNRAGLQGGFKLRDVGDPTSSDLIFDSFYPQQPWGNTTIGTSDKPSQCDVPNKPNRPFGSRNNPTWGQKNLVRPDKSRLQPYMVLQHEKQRLEAQRQRQLLAKEQQQHNQLGYHNQVEYSNKEDEPILQIQQRQPSACRDGQESFLARRAKSERHAPVRIPSNRQADRHIPATAPPQRHMGDVIRSGSQNAKEKESCVDDSVKHWVNSTH